MADIRATAPSGPNRLDKAIPSPDVQLARLVEHFLPGPIPRRALKLLEKLSRVIPFEGGHQFDGLRHVASLFFL